MPSKKQPLKQNDRILGKIKKFMNRKGVIQKVVTEGTISKYHVLFEGVSHVDFAPQCKDGIYMWKLTKVDDTHRILNHKK